MRGIMPANLPHEAGSWNGRTGLHHVRFGAAMPPTPDRLVTWPAWPTALGTLGFGGHINSGQGTGFTTWRRFGMYALVLLRSGNGTYRDSSGRSSPLSSGSIISVFPDLPHQYGPSTGAGWDESYLCFHGPAFAAWEHPGGLERTTPVWSVGDPTRWTTRISSILDSAVSDHPAACALLSSIHTLIASLCALRPPPPPTPPWLTTARQLLEDPSTPHRPLPSIARSCGITYDSFRRHFRQATGQSPRTYRRRHLVHLAASVYSRGHLTTDAVAEHFGFTDAAHLSRSFLQILGVRPRTLLHPPPPPPPSSA